MGSDHSGSGDKGGVVQRGVWVFLLLMLVFSGCTAVQTVTRTLAEISLPAFQLAGVENVTLAGISLARVRSLADLRLEHVMKLQRLFEQKTLPLECTVLVKVQNTPASAALRSVPITFQRIKWRLWIEQTPTVEGVVTEPISVPADGTTLVPVVARVDLLRFFANKSYQELVELALILAGEEGVKHIAVDIQPTIRAPILGVYQYPQPIRVVASEIRR